MKITLTTLCFFVVSVAAIAQDKNDVFDKQAKVTWLGLDFTGATLIGDRERWGAESDIRHLIEAWNNLILREHEKYDIARAIDKAQVEINIDATREHNANLDVLAMYSDYQKGHFLLKPDAIETIAAGYDYKGLQGIGLMFNIETFNKLSEEGTFWVTFIDMGTKRVMLTERVTAPPRGFGMRNYWAGSIYGALEKIRQTEFEMWRKKYYRS